MKLLIESLKKKIMFQNLSFPIIYCLWFYIIIFFFFYDRWFCIFSRRRWCSGSVRCYTGVQHKSAKTGWNVNRRQRMALYAIILLSLDFNWKTGITYQIWYQNSLFKVSESVLPSVLEYQEEKKKERLTSKKGYQPSWYVLCVSVQCAKL